MFHKIYNQHCCASQNISFSSSSSQGMSYPKTFRRWCLWPSVRKWRGAPSRNSSSNYIWGVSIKWSGLLRFEMQLSEQQWRGYGRKNSWLLQYRYLFSWSWSMSWKLIIECGTYITNLFILYIKSPIEFPSNWGQSQFPTEYLTMNYFSQELDWRSFLVK